MDSESSPEERDAAAREAAFRLDAFLGEVARGDVSLARMLGLHPQILEQLVQKAVGLIRHGKLDEGESLLERLSLVDVESPKLSLLLGDCLLERHAFDEAHEAYSEAIARAHRLGADAFLGEARLGRARARFELGQIAGARDDLIAATYGKDPARVAIARTILEQLDRSIQDGGSAG